MALTFDAATHTYTKDGILLPSVTQVMKPLTEYVYGTINQSTLDAAAERGTNVHQAIEFLVQYGAYTAEGDEKPYVEAFSRWAKDMNPKIEFQEKMFCHPSLLYAGTVDMIAIINGKRTLIDLKTTSRLETKLVRVQLEAYRRMIEACDPEKLFPIEEKYVLQLKKNGWYHYEKLETIDMAAWKVFLDCLDIMNWRNMKG